jgi:hypothetical protein
MKLRIFPREESYFDLFNEVAANIVDAARLLLDMVVDFVETEAKAKRLLDAEHEGDRLTHAIWPDRLGLGPDHPRRRAGRGPRLHDHRLVVRADHRRPADRRGRGGGHYNFEVSDVSTR